MASDEGTPLLAKSMDKKAKNNNTYSQLMGFVYTFNIMIGAGVLTLPKAFAEVGWALGLITLCFSALMSFVTITFIIEAMALANAMLRYQKSKWMESGEEVGLLENDKERSSDCIETTDEEGETKWKDNSSTENGIIGAVNFYVEERTHPKQTKAMDVSTCKTLSNAEVGHDSLSSLFDITVKMELGEIARLFYNKIGLIFYYILICVYMYGSATVYSAVIAKSMTTVVCNDPRSFYGNATKSCKRFENITVFSMYRMMLALFAVVICPFAYFDVKNTKVLQIFTTTYRWFSMFAMIIMALAKIANGNGNHGSINAFVPRKLTDFFGMSMYACMCHLSSPAVLTPIDKKKHLKSLVGLDFVCVVLFYATLVMSAVFAFPNDVIQDVYTLNFDEPSVIKYLLQLYPVLTLSATYPIFSIVLRENIKKLFLTNSDRYYGLFVERILFSTIAVVPPLCVAFVTNDVEKLVSYTGSYGGAIVMFVVPTTLVYFGRRKVRSVFGEYVNKHRSPFGSNFWLMFMLAWYLLSLVCTVFNTVMGSLPHKFDIKG